MQILALAMSAARVVVVTQGEKLDVGCSSEDYRITVGVGNCTVVDFFSNQITCEPPIIEPAADTTWLSLCQNSSSLLAVVVSVFVIISVILCLQL